LGVTSPQAPVIRVPLIGWKRTPLSTMMCR